MDPEDFPDDCYKVETYKRVYAPAILPIAEQNEWAPTVFIPPMPPNFGEQKEDQVHLGGLELKRLKVERRQSGSKCTKCRTSGHNSRSCPQVAQTISQDAHTTTQGEQENQVTRRQKKKVTRNKSMVQKVVESLKHKQEQGEMRTEVPTENAIVLPPRPHFSLVDEDDTYFEALLSQAMLSQASCDFQSLGMPPVPCKVGPTPYQQLHEDYTAPYVPTMLSGPSISAFHLLCMEVRCHNSQHNKDKRAA
ncbi:hypothetical protein ACS0TY_008113 [Phlomoides rotata]